MLSIYLLYLHLGIKIDTVPGRLNQTFFISWKNWNILCQCSEILEYITIYAYSYWICICTRLLSLGRLLKVFTFFYKFLFLDYNNLPGCAASGHSNMHPTYAWLCLAMPLPFHYKLGLPSFILMHPGMSKYRALVILSYF